MQCNKMEKITNAKKGEGQMIRWTSLQEILQINFLYTRTLDVYFELLSTYG